MTYFIIGAGLIAITGGIYLYRKHKQNAEHKIKGKRPKETFT